MGNTISYLPDGRLIMPPEDPHTWSEGERVSFDNLSHDVGQVGMFYAQRPMFQGLGTSATACAPGRTAIGLQTEIVDTHQGHSTTTSNANYAVPETGNVNYGVNDYYLCIGYVPLSTTDAADSFEVQLLPSVGNIIGGMMAPSGPGHNIDLMIVDIVSLEGLPSGSPTVQLDVYNFSASTVNTLTSSKCASLTIRWIGSARTFNTVSPNPTAHTWIPQDEATANATGASSQSPGVKVSLNTEITSNVQFYNSPPIGRLTAPTSTQSIPTGTTWTSIQFQSAAIDNFGGWSSSNTTRYTAQRAGLYLVSGYVPWSESTGTHNGYRAVRLRVNGDNTKVYGGNTILPTTGANADNLGTTAVALIQLNVGDYVELQMQQTQSNAPTSLTVYTANQGPTLIAVWQCL